MVRMKKITIILLLFIIVTRTVSAQSYTLGEGVQIGRKPFFIGGYFSLEYQQTKDQQSFSIDDLSFLGYGSFKNISYLAEIEFKELYSVQKRDTKTTTQTNTTPLIERLFVDYTLESSFFKVGKYDSYVGYWNLVPINVLRATTSNPQTTKIIFPTYTTGVEAKYKYYTNSGLFGIELSLQESDDLDDEYNNYEIDKHYGATLEYENDLWSCKINGGYFHLFETPLQSDREYLAFAFRIEHERYQVLAQLAKQWNNTRVTTPYAGYLQTLYRVNEHHHMIIRYESFEDTIAKQQDSFVIVGYTYRPLYPIALKGEYQLHQKDKDNTLLFSFSVLF